MYGVVNGYDKHGGLWFSEATDTPLACAREVAAAWAVPEVASVRVDVCDDSPDETVAELEELYRTQSVR